MPSHVVSLYHPVHIISSAAVSATLYYRCYRCYRYVELVDCKKLHRARPVGALARIGKALYSCTVGSANWSVSQLMVEMSVLRWY